MAISYTFVSSPKTKTEIKIDKCIELGLKVKDKYTAIEIEDNKANIRVDSEIIFCDISKDELTHLKTLVDTAISEME